VIRRNFQADEDDAQKCVDDFVKKVGWHPIQTQHAAGALLYTQCDLFKRQILKLIVGPGDGLTDSGKDYEFIDWDALAMFTQDLVEMDQSRC
jgi:menaquinone-dependent protoporphyrinogen IX oxidase